MLFDNAVDGKREKLLGRFGRQSFHNVYLPSQDGWLSLQRPFPWQVLLVTPTRTNPGMHE